MFLHTVMEMIDKNKELIVEKCKYERERESLRSSTEKLRAYERNKRISDSNFVLSKSIRSKTKQVFNLQLGSKHNKTIDLLGCSHESFRKWIKFQFTADMTVDNHGSIWLSDIQFHAHILIF